MFTIRYGLSLVCLICALHTAVGAEDPPTTNEKLKQLLKQFPKADTNADGILTLEEARAFRAANPVVTPTKSNVSYGPHERNVLDFYQADSDKPTPVIVFIHGGGFVGGDKKGVDPGILLGAKAAGISVASINYRFVDGRDVIFPAPQLDGARAVQFLRSQSSQWNIDPNHVACVGGSAGAGISMWIGFHDDLADPKNADPVLRQSTRIQAIGTFGGQGTYDPIKIKAMVGGRAWEHPSLLTVYGLKNTEEALNPTQAMQRLYDESAAITYLTKDDPALFMVYSEADGPLPENARPGEGIHHPNFGKQLKEKMDELGIANVYIHTGQAKGLNVSKELVNFIQKEFAKSR